MLVGVRTSTGASCGITSLIWVPIFVVNLRQGRPAYSLHRIIHSPFLAAFLLLFGCRSSTAVVSTKTFRGPPNPFVQILGPFLCIQIAIDVPNRHRADH